MKMLQNKIKKNYLTLIVLMLTISFASAESIVFSANKMSGQAGNSNSTTTLSGNSYIKTETMEIYADEVELSGDNYRNIKAAGHITGKNLKSNMDFSCEELTYDRNTKIAELKGNVNLNDKDNDVNAQSQIIIYNQDTEVAILQMKINLIQKDNICSGSYAVYYKTNQLLEISGNAQVKQGEDVFRAQYITLDMNTQDITLDGNVKGKVTETKKKEKTEESEEFKTTENETLPEESVESEDENYTEETENDEAAEGDEN